MKWRGYGNFEEEQEYLVEQLESLTSKRPLFYLKFCSQEKYAEDICNGKLYANTAEYFRKRELETGERGQGDQFELLLSIKTENITAIDNETGNVLFTAPKGMFNVQFKSDDELPIVSFTGIPLGDMKFVNADEHHAEFLFPFTDDEYDTMKERFGAYCVIIGARELESKIALYSLNNNCDYVFDKIDYCDQNRIDRIQAFNKSAKERFLYKNEDLSYQREYRLAVSEKMPDDHYISLGKLDNTKVLKADELKQLKFSIEYMSHIREE